MFVLKSTVLLFLHHCGFCILLFRYHIHDPIRFFLLISAALFPLGTWSQHLSTSLIFASHCFSKHLRKRPIFLILQKVQHFFPLAVHMDFKEVEIVLHDASSALIYVRFVRHMLQHCYSFPFWTICQSRYMLLNGTISLLFHPCSSHPLANKATQGKKCRKSWKSTSWSLHIRRRAVSKQVSYNSCLILKVLLRIDPASMPA